METVRHTGGSDGIDLARQQRSSFCKGDVIMTVFFQKMVGALVAIVGITWLAGAYEASRQSAQKPMLLAACVERICV